MGMYSLQKLHRLKGIRRAANGFQDYAQPIDRLIVLRIDRQRMLEQVRQLAEEGSVTTLSGSVLELHVDTLCVHGDNAEGVQSIREIRELLPRD